MEGNLSDYSFRITSSSKSFGMVSVHHTLNRSDVVHLTLPQSLYWRGDATNGDRTPLADILRIPKEGVDMDCPSKTSTIISVNTKEKLIKFWSLKTKI